MRDVPLTEINVAGAMTSLPSSFFRRSVEKRCRENIRTEVRRLLLVGSGDNKM